VPEPRQMRDFLIFEQHIRQARATRNRLTANGLPTDPAQIELPRVWYEEPIYYKCNRFSVVGTGVDVVMPGYTHQFDYELEFGFFLGRRGKNIRREDARSHIFGYCIFNDFSARDQQTREMQGMLGPTKGKDFDTGNAMGPWLATADEIPDPYSLTMVARVNGEERSRGMSGTMHHKFEDILAHVSKDETVYPGEFFGSGTVGNGSGMEFGRFLKPGDVIELEIDGLGVLRNRVVASRPVTP
jgi:2-keto-4-pentenoate hydratase/2-oxohepta-3-ene-1,7-dioic acid hydratase in catechol pathway